MGNKYLKILFKNLNKNSKLKNQRKEKNTKNKEIFNFIQKYKKKMKINWNVKFQSPMPRKSCVSKRKILSINPLLDKEEMEN